MLHLALTNMTKILHLFIPPSFLPSTFDIFTVQPASPFPLFYISEKFCRQFAIFLAHSLLARGKLFLGCLGHDLATFFAELLGTFSKLTLLSLVHYTLNNLSIIFGMNNLTFYVIFNSSSSCK